MRQRLIHEMTDQGLLPDHAVLVIATIIRQQALTEDEHVFCVV
jgi:hypothetical protein